MGLYLEEVIELFRAANQEPQFISLPSTKDVGEAVWSCGRALSLVPLRLSAAKHPSLWQRTYGTAY
jgi:hypothetical protein